MTRIVAYAPAVLWAIFLLWLGGRDAGTSLQVPGLDKVAHLVLYGILGALAGWGWRRSARAPGAAIVIALACAVGLADELHQSRVPTRTAEPYDFIADAAGVLLGFAAGRGRPTRGRGHDPA